MNRLRNCSVGKVVTYRAYDANRAETGILKECAPQCGVILGDVGAVSGSATERLKQNQLRAPLRPQEARVPEKAPERRKPPLIGHPKVARAHRLEHPVMAMLEGAPSSFLV